MLWVRQAPLVNENVCREYWKFRVSWKLLELNILRWDRLPQEFFSSHFWAITTTSSCLTLVSIFGLGTGDEVLILNSHWGIECRVNPGPWGVTHSVGSSSEPKGANSEGVKDNSWFCFSSAWAGHISFNTLNPQIKFPSHEHPPKALLLLLLHHLSGWLGPEGCWAWTSFAIPWGWHCGVDAEMVGAFGKRSTWKGLAGHPCGLIFPGGFCSSLAP